MFRSVIVTTRTFVALNAAVLVATSGQAISPVVSSAASTRPAKAPVPRTADKVEVIAENSVTDETPPPADIAYALDRARERAETDSGLAPPYYDPATKRLVAPAVNSAGESAAAAPIRVPNDVESDDSPDPDAQPIAEDKAGNDNSEDPLPDDGPEGKSVQTPALRVPPVARDVHPVVTRAPHSYAVLNKINDEFDLNEFGEIWGSVVDGERDQVLLFAESASEQLRQTLNSRYGDKVAIELSEKPGADDSVGAPDEEAAAKPSREADTSPFIGGARYRVGGAQCTTGWGWKGGSTYYILTAGHCTTMGASARTPAASMGRVTADNYGARGTGRSSDGRFHGDVSVIRVGRSARWMYWGPVYKGRPSTKDIRVGHLPRGKTGRGTMLFTSGAYSGGRGGWRVTRTGATHEFLGGRVARNVSYAERADNGSCLQGGDSGGPVYTINRSTGRVEARGVISGMFQRFRPARCVLVYTDIRDAWAAMPGTLLR